MARAEEAPSEPRPNSHWRTRTRRCAAKSANCSAATACRASLSRTTLSQHGLLRSPSSISPATLASSCCSCCPELCPQLACLYDYIGTCVCDYSGQLSCQEAGYAGVSARNRFCGELIASPALKERCWAAVYESGQYWQNFCMAHGL